MWSNVYLRYDISQPLNLGGVSVMQISVMQIIAMQITVMPVAIKKIIFIAKVGSKTMLKSEVCAINSHPYHKISPGAAGAYGRRTGCGKGYYLLPKVPQKMERLKRDEIN